MSDKTFAKVMSQIAAQDEAEKARELVVARRRRVLARARGGIMALLWAALLGCGFYYRAELQQFASETFFGKPKAGQIDAKTSATLQGIQAQASKRDQVLDQVAK